MFCGANSAGEKGAKFQKRGMRSTRRGCILSTSYFSPRLSVWGDAKATEKKSTMAATRARVALPETRSSRQKKNF
jgi:hypothetical protein